PLSIDGSALTLYLDALDPDMASQGGTGLAPALRQGGELLQASSELADRVIVVFTDGEAHDSLPPITAQAERLKADGIRLILVAADARRGAAGRAGRLAANRRARRAGLRVSHRAARERGAAAPTAAEPCGKGMGPSRPPARARRVPGGARRPSQRGRCLVQRGYRGIGRLGRRDGAGEPGARRRIARSRPAVPRVVQSRAARAAPGS